MTDTIQISKRTARRFILGRSGLWPGRRWRGKAGIRQALHQIEALQIDPVTVLTQSHHLALWSRVLDFDPADLDKLMYRDREFFDWGGALFIYPLADWPALKQRMQAVKREKRWADFAAGNQTLIKRVLQEIRTRGPLLKREIAGEKVENYRGTKDSGVALHYLFLIGELMSFDRQGKQRRYELTERILPDHLNREISAIQVRMQLIKKGLAQLGLAPLNRVRGLLKSFSPSESQQHLDMQISNLLEDSFLLPVKIEKNKRNYFALAEDALLLDEIAAGHTPSPWQAIEITELEAVFLSPLDYVSARGRAAEHFDFDYKWELYKRPGQRQYGPYTLPILFEDRLVARIDMKADRDSRNLIVNGYWQQESFESSKSYELALSRAFRRLLPLLKTDSMYLDALPKNSIIRKLAKLI